MTEVWKIDLQSPDPLLLREVAVLLRKDGIIAYPTETYYALGGNPFSATAVRKIFRIKERAERKPLLVLVSTLDELDTLVSEISSEARQLIQEFWPGPLTILFKAASRIPEELTGGTGKIGIRLPDSSGICGLLRGVGMPLTGTSANLSGHDSINDPRILQGVFEGKIDAILNAGLTPGGLPSTVVDATLHPPVIQREGRIPDVQIRKTFEM